MDFIRKNLEHFFNFLKYILERLLCIILILSIIIIATIFFFRNSVIINPSSFESQEILFCGISLGNLSAWFAAITIIITAIWSMYQFIKSVSRKQQEKGASIAKDFTSGLLDKCGIVTVVFKKSKLYKLLNSHEEYNSFRNFTVSELRDIYGNELPAIYRAIEQECNLDKIYHDLLKNRITEYSNKSSSSYNRKNKKSNHNRIENNEIRNTRDLFILDNKDLPFHFGSLVDDVLNELEYICMDISSQAADSKYIYQSLHQIFLGL